MVHLSVNEATDDMKRRAGRMAVIALHLCASFALATPRSVSAEERPDALRTRSSRTPPKRNDAPRIPAARAEAERQDAPAYHRYAFLGAGALAAGGVVFGFIAHGQQERAKTLSSAAEAAKTREDARQSAATANVLYALAGATLVYALVLEFLPKPAAEKASLAVRF